MAMRHERKLILLFCAVAAVRVFAFSAAFPFFNNVDEQAHFDLVMKSTRGQVPRDLGHYSSESAHYLSLYGTPEYTSRPQSNQHRNFSSADLDVSRRATGRIGGTRQQPGGKTMKTTNLGNHHFIILPRVCG